jgi:hypothetical protein
MDEITISEDLASALDALVKTSDAADQNPTDRQVARRAIEQARLVVELARREGFGNTPTSS